MSSTIRNLKIGFRALAKNSIFASLALVTLALAIGANTATFSVVSAVLLHPFSFSEPQRLASVIATDPRASNNPLAVSFTKFSFLRKQSHTLETCSAYYTYSVSVSTNGHADQATAARVSSDIFRTLGTAIGKGRTFLPQEDNPDATEVAILSNGFWHSHFAANPDILGKSIAIDGVAVTVIGILPGEFEFPLAYPEPEVWLPGVDRTNFLTIEQVHSGASYLALIGRVRQGETLTHVRAEMGAINESYKQQFGNYADAATLGLSALSLEESLVGTLRPSLLILQAAVGFVLLIACANVASMFLTRAIARQKEFAIRSALGASRAQLVAQLLCESLILSLAGGILGIILAAMVVPLLRAISPGTVPRLDHARIDFPVLIFTLGLCASSAVLFGLVPALKASGGHLSESLKEGGRGSSGSVKNRRLRGTLVAGEVAIALVLLIGVGLLTRSFARTVAVNPGFQSRGVIAFPITLPASKYAEPARQAEFYRKLVERVQALPGAGHVAVTTYLPLSGSARFVFFCPEGFACQGLGKDPIIAVRQITPDYFQTIQTPVLRGRAFADQDSADNLKTVIVNQSVANHYWPNQDPLGKHLANSRDRIQRTVVGVVADVKFNSLTSPVIEEMYLPLAQSPAAAASLIVRSQSDVSPLVSSARNALGTIDPEVSFGTIQRMDELVAASLAQPRLTMQFMGVFAALALMLSVTGLYAVMSYIVLQQKRELGIRMALGAQRAQVLRMVLQHGMTVTSIGLAIGAALSFALTRLLAGLLFDIRPTDPLTFAASTFILALTALIACYLPARRAAQVDPIVTLRDE